MRPRGRCGSRVECCSVQVVFKRRCVIVARLLDLFHSGARRRYSADFSSECSPPFAATYLLPLQPAHHLPQRVFLAAPALRDATCDGPRLLNRDATLWNCSWRTAIISRLPRRLELYTPAHHLPQRAFLAAPALRDATCDGPWLLSRDATRDGPACRLVWRFAQLERARSNWPHHL